MEKSLQQLLRDGLKQACDSYEGQGGPSEEFKDFCANHLVKVLTPVMTAIQKHIESCPVTTFESYEIPNEPSVHVPAKLSVDGAALPPFYTRRAQEETPWNNVSAFSKEGR